MKKLFLYGYYLFLLFFAVFPFHTAGIHDLDKSYVGTFRLDHLLHFFVFAPLMPLQCIAFQCKNNIVYLKKFLLGLAITFVCEGVQYFLPYRSFNFTDMVANAGGLVLSLIIVRLVRFEDLLQKLEKDNG